MKAGRAALALGAAGLSVAGALTGSILLPVAAVPCLFGAVILSGRPRPTTPPAEAFDELDVRAALDRLQMAVPGRLAPDINARVSRIRQLLVVVLSACERAGIGASDPDVFHVRQMALSYLPEALDAFLAVPGMFANRSSPGRKSPHETLVEQLVLMEDSLSRLAEAIAAEGTDRLEAHGRFLLEALGRSRLDVLADTEATPPRSERAGPLEPPVATPGPAAGPATGTHDQ